MAFTFAGIRTIDAKLEIGTQNQVIEVSGDAVTLQVDSPVRSSPINSKQITELPFSGRNPVALALTVPGVSTSRIGVGGTGSFSMNGSRSRSNNFLIDGTENNDISVAGEAFIITLPDMVQETSVQTSNYDAEFGRAAGAVVNVVTNDDAITTTQGLDPAVQKRGKPLSGTENIWGATFGGPIIKNKTFFFAGSQEDRQKSSGSSTAAAPTAAGWAPLNSLFPNSANPLVDLYRAVLAGTTATAQPTIIARGNNRPGIEFGTATLGYVNFVGDRLFSIKGDHRFSDSDSMSARYATQDRPIRPASVSYPGMNTSQANLFKNGIFSETHIFSPSMTNELRLGYNRIDLVFPVDTTRPLGRTCRNTPSPVCRLPTSPTWVLPPTFPRGALPTTTPCRTPFRW